MVSVVYLFCRYTHICAMNAENFSHLKITLKRSLPSHISLKIKIFGKVKSCISVMNVIELRNQQAPY